MKNVVFIILILSSIIKSNTIATTPTFTTQKNDKFKLRGAWQYFENDGTYNEVVFTEDYAYIISEKCKIPEKIKFEQIKNTVSLPNGEYWEINSLLKNSIEVVINKNSIILYLMSLDEIDDVQLFYERLNDQLVKTNTEDGFYKRMTERKHELKEKIKAHNK